VDDHQTKLIEELTSIQASGVRFSIDRRDRRFVVILGPDIYKPVAMAVIDDLGHAVLWLREQVKTHYPHCAYSRHLLIN
jgi:hypothetical protein